jgi:hypothetical protein
MCATMDKFDRIQGGEAGESPLRALTAEPTPKSVKFISAWGLRGFLAGSVLRSQGEIAGDLPPCDRALCQPKIRSNAVHGYL